LAGASKDTGLIISGLGSSGSFGIVFCNDGGFIGNVAGCLLAYTAETGLSTKENIIITVNNSAAVFFDLLITSLPFYQFLSLMYYHQSQLVTALTAIGGYPID